MVVPVDPFGGGQFYIGQIPPFENLVNQFSLVQADRGLHQGVVVGVPDTANGGLDVGLSEVGAEAETRVLLNLTTVSSQGGRCFRW